MTRKIKNCKQCTNPCNNPYAIYCSNKCQVAYQRETGVKNGTAKWGMLRSYVLARDNHRCTLCGIADWQGKPLIFTVDHVDGNSDNNTLTNLRAICPNCDSQLPTYKAKNMGRGRTILARQKQRVIV